jgi:hypothetical protein
MKIYYNYKFRNKLYNIINIKFQFNNLKNKFNKNKFTLTII